MKRTFLFFLLCLHLFILSQLQFTAWPEMVSFPYLINHGFILYKDAIHAYPPLLVNILAILFKTFGYKISVLKILGWITILSSDFIFFLILQKLIKKNNIAILSLLIYIILQSVLEGNMVWPDLFIVPFLLLTFLFLLEKKYFWSGIAIGLAIMTKQTGVLFLGISGIWLFIYERRRIKNILNFIFGVLIATLPFLFSLFQQNSFGDFLNWAFIYPAKYWTKFPGYVQLSPTLRENLILLLLFLPLTFFVIKAKKKVFTDKYFLLLFGFLLAGIIGIYPRFSFFHFQSALVFLIILIFFLNQKTDYRLLLLPILILILSFRSLQTGESRFWTIEDIGLGQIIQNESPDNKPIYLLGLDSNLYTFANRLPNKPWLDNFGWYLEIPGVQESVIQNFKLNPPSTVFWATPESGNWYDIGTYQPQLITGYIVKNYTKTKEIQKGIWEWTKK